MTEITVFCAVRRTRTTRSNNALALRLPGNLGRLPPIVGNYHFHPQDQPEYHVQESLTAMLPNIMKV